ncbi:MAG: amino acid permease [Saprospiraceae bacterium]|nr:amino acid permease [Saprospiraceae bacterium]
MSEQKAPLATVAKALLGNIGLQLLLIGGIISIIGSLLTGIMAFSRVLFAGGFNGSLPKVLARVQSKYTTPYIAILTLCLFSFILACTGGFRHLIVIATNSMLVLFAGVALALIKFRMKETQESVPVFKLPGGVIILLFSLLIIIWFLSHSKKEEIGGIVVFLIVFTLIYFLKKYFK